MPIGPPYRQRLRVFRRRKDHFGQEDGEEVGRVSVRPFRPRDFRGDRTARRDLRPGSGVGFRFFAQRPARYSGVKGWVPNRIPQDRRSGRRGRTRCRRPTPPSSRCAGPGGSGVTSMIQREVSRGLRLLRDHGIRRHDGPARLRPRHPRRRESCFATSPRCSPEAFQQAVAEIWRSPRAHPPDKVLGIQVRVGAALVLLRSDSSLPAKPESSRGRPSSGQLRARATASTAQLHP